MDNSSRYAHDPMPAAILVPDREPISTLRSRWTSKARAQPSQWGQWIPRQVEIKTGYSRTHLYEIILFKIVEAYPRDAQLSMPSQRHAQEAYSTIQ
jgi:hypothetical protein